eukprot:Awhi_evm1s4251
MIIHKLQNDLFREYDCIYRTRTPSGSLILYLWYPYNVIVALTLTALGVIPLIMCKDLKVRYRGIVLICCIIFSQLFTIALTYANVVRKENGNPPTKTTHIFLSLDIIGNATFIYIAALPVDKVVAFHKQVFGTKLNNKYSSFT